MKNGAVQGLDSLAGVSKASQYGMYSNRFVQTAVHTTARTAINSAVYGTDFADSLRENLKNAGIDEVAKVLTTGVGDRQEQLGGEGSLQKTLLHAGIGCTAASAKGGDCASGAIGGAIAEQLSGTMNNNQISNKWDTVLIQYASILGAAATGLDASEASDAANRTDKNNRMLHSTRELERLRSRPNFKHGINSVVRDNPEDFSKEDKERFGEPIKIFDEKGQFKGYGYMFEHTRLNEKLVPIVNGKYLKNGILENDRKANTDLTQQWMNDPEEQDSFITLGERPDNYLAEDDMMNNYWEQMNSPDDWKDYPSDFHSVVCTISDCYNFYNSNSAFKEMQEKSGLEPILPKPNDDNTILVGALPPLDTSVAP